MILIQGCTELLLTVLNLLQRYTFNLASLAGPGAYVVAVPEHMLTAGSTAYRVMKDYETM